MPSKTDRRRVRIADNGNRLIHAQQFDKTTFAVLFQERSIGEIARLPPSVTGRVMANERRSSVGSALLASISPYNCRRCYSSGIPRLKLASQSEAQSCHLEDNGLLPRSGQKSVVLRNLSANANRSGANAEKDCARVYNQMPLGCPRMPERPTKAVE